MMNNLFNAIVIAVLVGTVVMAPLPQPSPPAVASRSPATAAIPSAIDSAAAKAAIEACGYREVSMLVPATDGTWRAKAYKGTTQVQVTVDGTGKVSFQ
ncbi:MAG TPA: hypothetical protein VFF19_10285 [Reyranella sp.]|jgi:hypothetical protein|nr:hypothetical protein [Reyranella sp.]